jgi:hypothetical protein
VLERMKLISSSADTEKPSCVLPHLFIGGALAARCPLFPSLLVNLGMVNFNS